MHFVFLKESSRHSDKRAPLQMHFWSSVYCGFPDTDVLVTVLTLAKFYYRHNGCFQVFSRIASSVCAFFMSNKLR